MDQLVQRPAVSQPRVVRNCGNRFEWDGVINGIPSETGGRSIEKRELDMLCAAVRGDLVQMEARHRILAALFIQSHR